MVTSSKVTPVILCGGSGTRLWPASRDSLPKQFIPLLGTLSTFQATLRRVADQTLFSRPLVVTNQKFRFLVEDQAKAIDIPIDILLEPVGRDSAPAIAAASVVLQESATGNLALILAADHVINNTAGFVASVRDAIPAADNGAIMTFGIVPGFASTAYGYVATGKAINGAALSVSKFLEKPNSAKAEELVSAGCLWNSGNFLFRPDVMLKELATFEPELFTEVTAAVAKHELDLGARLLNADAFGRATKISIDYAVMQRTALAGVVKARFDWSDIGTWGSLWDASPHDENGNTTSGPVELLNTRNSIVHAENVLTTLVGLEDVVVVSTRDAVLVTKRDESGQIKTLVDALKAEGRSEATEHLKMYRPWGAYERIDIGRRFQVKRITVNPGGRLSLQKHFHRSEHWVVVTGTAEVTVGDKVLILHENESTYIPLGEVHRLANPGKIPLEIIEIQVGAYTGEDDIVRIEDTYGRT
jgi:mannose-1-phosphate guanylyltransferase/mannose-6-phosphate isomerase